MPNIKIQLKNRGGKYLETIEVPENTLVTTFKEIFYQKHHYYPERQWWTIGDDKKKVLKDGTLQENGIVDGSTLVFKDLGVQISWRLVFVLEYFGPLFIFPVFYYYTDLIYDAPIVPEKTLVQKLAFWIAMLHFLKREIETLFIHRFSSSTMPIIRVPLNCGHYWILCGVFISFFLFHPKYMSPWDHSPSVVYFITSVIILFEYLNFRTHLILRNLRPRGTRSRGIPYGFGFDYVSCANYFYEGMMWILFSILVSTFTAWLFTFVACAQMTVWALKKHAQYKKEFSDYPRNRKAVIPFIL